MEKRDEKVLNEFYVAGVKFHHLMDCIDEIETGDCLALRLEPENKYDSNAIAIEFVRGDGSVVMTGYVPRKFSAQTTAKITVGKAVFCEVTEINKGAKPWERLKVALKEVIPSE